MSDQVASADAIFRAIAYSFFIPIHRGQLQVAVRRDGCVDVLDQDKLYSILNDEKELQKRGGVVISGRNAYAAYRTFSGCANPKKIRTPYGQIDLFYRLADPEEVTHLSLYRQGMFITEEIPQSKRHYFNSFKRFNAVINVKVDHHTPSSAAFQVIRKSETSKHLAIDPNLLRSADKEIFDDIFKRVNEEIKKCSVKEESGSFSPNIFRVANMSDSKSWGRNSSRRVRNTVAPFERQKEGLSGGTGNSRGVRSGNNRGNKTKPMKVEKNLPCKASVVRRGEDVVLLVQSNAEINDGLLRLRMHSGSDLSCDSPIPYTEVRCEVTHQGTESPKSSRSLGSFVKNEKKSFDVRLKQSIPADAVLEAEVFIQRSIEDDTVS